MALAGCGDGSSPELTPSSVLAAGGQGQVAAASSVLPDSLAVVVRDGGGAPLAGITVNWQAASGGGTVSPVTSVTSASGIARASRTLSATAGTHTTTATVAGLAPVTFTAVAQIQGATTMGNRSIGPLADTVLGTLTEIEQPLKVLVLDQDGVPVPGVIVQWSASSGGSVAAPTGVTDAGGESVMEYTFGSEARGGYGARAAVPGLIGSPVDFLLDAHPATPVAIVKTNGDGVIVQAGQQVIYTVNVRDSYGNGAQGVTVQWNVVTGGGSIAPAQNFSGNGGHAEATRTLGLGLGEQTASATAPALPGAPSVTFSTLAATTVVRVANNVFLPSDVTIQGGDSVAWQWQGTTVAHNITFTALAGAPVDVPDRTSGAVWRIFNVAGTFSYQCTNHAGMTGRVTVNP